MAAVKAEGAQAPDAPVEAPEVVEEVVIGYALTKNFGHVHMGASFWLPKGAVFKLGEDDEMISQLARLGAKMEPVKG